MNIPTTMNSIQHAQYLRQQIRRPQHPQKKPSKLQQKLALVLTGVIAFTPAANAAMPPDMEIFNNMHEVSDSELGHMRGKYAGGNQVLYFGVEILSQWQTSSGSVITAGADLNIDFRNGSTPTVQYAPTVTITQEGQGIAAQTSGTNSVSGGAGLATVSGVSQNIQVAGQTNKIHNDINMQIELTSGANGGSIGNAVQGQAGTTSVTGGDGSTATVTLSNNSIGVNVTVPGQGQILQQIRNQGLFQSARIGGDLNQIHNAITMHIGLNAATGVGSVGAYAALQSLKSLPRNGFN